MDEEKEAAEREELLRRLMEAIKSPGSSVSNEKIRNILSLTQSNFSKEFEKVDSSTSSGDDLSLESGKEEEEQEEDTEDNNEDENKQKEEEEKKDISEENKGEKPEEEEELQQRKEKESKSLVSRLRVYSRRSGSTDLGRDYETKITALLSLRCAALKDTKEMWLGSNVDNVGDFDDIVLCRRTSEGKNLAYMIQLKHQEKPKNITQHDLVHAEKKTARREKSKEDFSLIKYSKGFAALMSQIGKCKEEDEEIIQYLRKADRVMFILYTNKGVNECQFLKSVQDEMFSFLDTSEIKESVLEFDHDSLGFDPQFLQKLVLFANQIHLNDADRFIKKEIKHFLASVGVTNIDFKKATKKFVAFIKSWAEGFENTQKESKVFNVLTKSDIINKLIDIVLDPLKLDFSKENYSFYECPKKALWNEIICDKAVTVVDSDELIQGFLKQYVGSEVRLYCSKSKGTWLDLLSKNIQNSLYEKYPDFVMQTTNKESTMFDIYRCLWFNGEIPLLVKIDSIEEYCTLLKILKLNYKLRVVILKNKSTVLPITKNSSHFGALNDLSSVERSKILLQPVKLQGREFSTLEDLSDESMYKHIKCKDIINILCNEFNCGNEYKFPIQYFIARSLSKAFLNREVLRKVPDEIFVIENFDSAGENYDNVLPSLEQAQVHNSKHKTLHKLVYFNELFFEWKESFGSTKNIKKYQWQDLYEIMHFRNEKVIYAPDIENFWIPLEDTINDSTWTTTKIISANPGAGKSILMTQIARIAQTNMWVVKINLNEHEDYYKTLKDQTPKARECLMYFCKEIFTLHGCACEADLALGVFQKFLDRKKVLVLLDGFDEISIAYRDEVTKIAKTLHDEGFHMWITTRPVMKMYLEQVFDTFSLDLKPFTSNNQEEFLKHYFASVGEDLGNSVLEDFVRELLRGAKANLIDADCKFTGIPLQTQMLADVFSSEYRNSLKRGAVSFNKKFDLLYLYEEFLKKKTDILCAKFGKDAERTRVLFEEHQILFSLKTVFEKNILHGLNIEERLEERCKGKMQEIQFLQREGVLILDQSSSETKYKFNVNFVHRTFAEFLAAKWLAENFACEDEIIKNSVRTLVMERFRQWSLTVFLFKIFDRILARNCDSHLAVINDQLAKVRLDDLHVKDKGGRTILHIIALRGIRFPNYYENFQNLKDKMVDIIDKILNVETPDVKDDVLGYNWLDYALANDSLAVANKICEKYPHLPVNVEISPVKNGRYLSYCIALKYRFLFKKLVFYFASRDMLIWGCSSNILIKSYCSRVEQELQGETFHEYLNELGVKTISELFKLKHPEPDYYSDLRMAAAFGAETNVSFLLSQGANPNELDVDENTPFIYAVTRGRLEVVRILLDGDAEVNKPGYGGHTALHYASKIGHNEIVEELLAHGADVNSSNHNSNTPIHFALMNGHLNTFNILLLNGASSNVVSKDGNSLLHYAAGEGSVDIVSEVLTRNREPLNQQNSNGCTPLRLAAAQGSKDAVKLLLAEGADCNIQDKYGNSALHLATRNGDDEIIELLSKDALLDLQNHDGETALHLASSRQRLPTIKLLLSKGASCNIKNSKGFSPLLLTAKEGRTEVALEIVLELLNSGADISSSNLASNVPLHYSIMNRNLEVTRLLLNNNADVNMKDINNNTALHYAANAQSVELVSELLAKGADINALTVYKKTPLLYALAYGHVDVAKMLLSSGAQWDNEDTHGRTALHYAADIGCTDLVLQFLINGLDVNKQTHDGDTALHLCARRCRLDTVRVLLENSAAVDVQNVFGKTPLHVSVTDIRFSDSEMYARQKSVVRLLLDYGASVNLKDCDGNTALLCACKRKSGTPKNIIENMLNYFYIDVLSWLVEKDANLNLRDNEGKTALDLASGAGYTSLVTILQNGTRTVSLTDITKSEDLQTDASNDRKLMTTFESKGLKPKNRGKRKKKHK